MPIQTVKVLTDYDNIKQIKVEIDRVVVRFEDGKRRVYLIDTFQTGLM